MEEAARERRPQATSLRTSGRKVRGSEAEAIGVSPKPAEMATRGMIFGDFKVSIEGQSRNQAHKTWSGRQVIDELKRRGIGVKSRSQRGVAEDAPGAYKDVGAVVEATELSGLAKKVARLAPMISIKG